MIGNSVLYVHSGETTLRTVLNRCLPVLIEQIHPNALRRMDKRRFVTSMTHLE